MLRRVLSSARRFRAKARKLPRPWPFVRLLAARPRGADQRRSGDVTLRAPAAEETVAQSRSGGRVVAVWPESLLATGEGRDAFERWHRAVTRAGVLHRVEVRRSDEADA